MLFENLPESCGSGSLLTESEIIRAVMSISMQAARGLWRRSSGTAEEPCAPRRSLSPRSTPSSRCRGYVVSYRLEALEVPEQRSAYPTSERCDLRYRYERAGAGGVMPMGGASVDGSGQWPGWPCPWLELPIRPLSSAFCAPSEWRLSSVVPACGGRSRCGTGISTISAIRWRPLTT